MIQLNQIVAVDQEGGISKDKEIPWIKEPFAKRDLKNFKKLTDGHVVVMGRNTYEDMFMLQKKRSLDTIKEKGILPNRKSYVVTRTLTEAPGAEVIKQWNTAHEDNANEIFIIGGERLFVETLSFTKRIYMTVVKGAYKCDQFFPVWALPLYGFKIIDGRQDDDLYFVTYER